MALLATSQVSMHYTGPDLLEEVSVSVERGRKIGLIGRNGSGKSTLLKILGGMVEPTNGHVVRQKGVTVGYQAQELDLDPGWTVNEAMRHVFADAFAREARMRELEQTLDDPKSLREYERLAGEHTYGLDRRIEQMLISLGLPGDRPLAGFSGGERNVIGLARVLLAEPDVMLLDEPSNHLDMDGVEWFEEFMKRSEAAIVMVSHNRWLLDRCVDEIWELERKAITRWTGNYGQYKQQKAEALALQERRYKSQQRTIERIEFQARRLMDMASAYDDPGQAKRAKAMRRRIERMDKVEKPSEDKRRFAASLKGGARHGRIALRLRDFSFSHGERVLFDRLDLEIDAGERVCLVGPNGSGKTTLLRHVLEHGSWDNEACRLGKSVRVGEYRQLHDVLDADATLVRWTAVETGLDRSDAARLLHRFLFTIDDLERPIHTLSGGEKSRLQLARLVHAKVNFLVLDEPTNHLDLRACEQLEAMLEEFDGTLLIVSHDRYFLERLVERVLEVSDRGLLDHRGGFKEWCEQRERQRRTILEARGEPKRDKSVARQDYADRKERQRELTRLKSQLSKLEARITALETQQEELKVKLEEVYTSGPPQRAVELNRNFEGVKEQLAGLYREWETVAAALE